jgi:hypothetical protein
MMSDKFAMVMVSVVCAWDLGWAPLPGRCGGFRAYHAEARWPAGAVVTEKDVGGVAWRCEGDKCIGKAERYSSLDSYMKECRKVSAGLGKLTRFYSRGREMTGATSRAAIARPLRKPAAAGRASVAHADALESRACITPRSKTSSSFSMT